MQSIQLELFGDNNPASSFGKTFPVSSTQKTTPSDTFSLASLTAHLPMKSLTASGEVQVLSSTGSVLSLGAHSMLNISECPNAVEESTLSQVLEKDSVPSRFFLSELACRGILARAKRRGKDLPPLLKEALESSLSRQ